MRIIYVDVDTLRADHTTPYGYHRPTTPNLQRLADKSVVFDRYYCSDSPCMPSRTALTSGQFGITNGVIGHFGSAAQFRLDAGHGPEPDRPLLGQLLQFGGYHTTAISVFAERHRAYYFHGNFRESIRATPNWGDEDASDINRAAFDWLHRHASQDNWYLHLTYWEPHTNYTQPVEWTEKMAESGPVQAWPDAETIAAHAEIYGPRSALDLNYSMWGARTSPVPHNMPDAITDRADFEHLINGFDGAISYWDHHFGQLLATLEELGIAEDTAIIVSADHGESLGELGMYAEHGMASEPVHRLPLVVYWPGVTDRLPADSRRNDALLYNIDLAPTLCEMLDLPKPAGWQGESFAAALRGEDLESRPYLVLGHGAMTYQRAVRTPDHLYIRTYHPGTFRTEWEQLFHVADDPYLTDNLIDREPELAAHLRSYLMQWWDEVAGRPGCLPDPMQSTLQVGPTLYSQPDRYAQHLRDTGRAHLAEHMEANLSAVNVPVPWHAPHESRTAQLVRKWSAMTDVSAPSH
ncbi:sulfatase-like hydrolase/transferase [Nocardia sp. NEAU-G5]|uniref:Sulfatase-like hydrolase/transferase n=1 Tax=Nocardia albiluteola TaxID=2842303 RepID=A0ABS6AXB8_9NOCA|nr:sulfatase [Nocardia albiluteola]MBU3062528.1 sulfatase-like hydrolase/transferase [Nocardia albiluteola]MBU3065638.1 sulfatase-like hydrolase/transferase [Nocardia albiluteola]